MSNLETKETGAYADYIRNFEEAIDNDQFVVANDNLGFLEDVSDNNKEVHRYLEENRDMATSVVEKITFINRLLEEMHSDDWVRGFTAKDITCYFNNQNGRGNDSPSLFSKTVTVFKCDPEQRSQSLISLVSLFTESDLMPRWYPKGVLEAHENMDVESLDNFTQISRATIKLPPPLNLVVGPREAVLKTVALDNPKERCLTIGFESFDDEDDNVGFELPETRVGYTRMQIRGVYHFEIMEEGIKFTWMQLMKFNLGKAVRFNLFSKRKFLLKFIERMRNRLRKFEGSEWDSRVTMRHDGLYPGFLSRLGMLPLHSTLAEDEARKRTESRTTLSSGEHMYSSAI